MIGDYLIGELSARLEDLQICAPRAALAVARLRRQVESGPPAGLAAAAAAALELADAACWDSLSRGDAQAFTLQASTAAELRLFAACAHLLGPGPG